MFVADHERETMKANFVVCIIKNTGDLKSQLDETQLNAEKDPDDYHFGYIKAKSHKKAAKKFWARFIDGNPAKDYARQVYYIATRNTVSNIDAVYECWNELALSSKFTKSKVVKNEQND